MVMASRSRAKRSCPSKPSVVNTVKTLSKREQEEMKKKEQEKAAEVFEEFLASFESNNKSGVKTFVRGGIVNATKEEEAAEVTKNKLYRPATKLTCTTASQQQVVPSQPAADAKRPIFKKKTEEKKKSNLELFKEELKQIQEQREERHKRKQGDPVGGGGDGGFGDLDLSLSRRSVLFDDPFDPAVPNTTNLYIGGISPKMNEELLCKEFVKYGPLASVKIMWPRSEEERARNCNRGFVAFMTRKDAERAMASLNGKVVMGMEMKLGWGKAVRIPPQPLYRAMVLKKAAPPPPSGLPFNAQPKDRFRNDFTRPPDRPRDEFDKTLSEAIVRVVIPTERSLLSLIHRMIEFVVREGPMFEAIIMNKEKNNPDFRFLFDNKSQDHVYYRWKLYSILQGETPSEWRASDFRMFRGGSLWRPPPLNPYLHDNQEEEEGEGGEGGEEENASQEEEEEVKRGQLRAENRTKLESLVKELTPLREDISSAMVFCLNRAQAAEEVVALIAESFGLIQTPLQKKIARLYLISDILHNSSAKVKNASYYRKYFEQKLPQIFADMNLAYKNIQARLQAEQFKQKVMCCFRAWEDWAVYPESYLITLQNIFLGLVKAEEILDKPEESSPDLDGAPLDGLPLDGAPLDGLPLDGAPLDGVPLDGAPLDGVPLDGPPAAPAAVEDLDGAPLGWDPLDGVPVEDDLDGIPLGGAHPATADDIDGMPLDDGSSVVSTVALSKWEQMGDTEAFPQARTESKWDTVKEPDSEEDLNESWTNQESDDDDSSEEEEESGCADSASSLKSFQSELSRKRLRELEVKVMKVQDELESGKRPRKCGRSVQQQVEHYRNKLLRKEFDRDREERKRGRSSSKSKDRSKEERRGDKDRGDKDRGDKERKEDRRRGRSRDSEEQQRCRSHSPVRTKRSKRSKSPASPDRKSHDRKSASLRSRSRSPQHRPHKAKKSKR